MSINLAEATDTKTQTCCFTGHRKIPMLDRMRISRQLDTTIQKLVDEGICYFGAGGALGFDTMAAQACTEKESADKIDFGAPVQNADVGLERKRCRNLRSDQKSG